MKETLDKQILLHCQRHKVTYDEAVEEIFFKEPENFIRDLAIVDDSVSLSQFLEIYACTLIDINTKYLTILEEFLDISEELQHLRRKYHSQRGQSFFVIDPQLTNDFMVIKVSDLSLQTSQLALYIYLDDIFLKKLKVPMKSGRLYSEFIVELTRMLHPRCESLRFKFFKLEAKHERMFDLQARNGLLSGDTDQTQFQYLGESELKLDRVLVGLLCEQSHGI